MNTLVILLMLLLVTFLTHSLVRLASHLLLYGAISTPQTTIDNESEPSFASESNGSNKAGSTSLENTGNSEMMGLAVFKGDKLVGELTAEETLCHLLIRNKIESCNISIPNPEDKNASIDLYIYNKSSPKIKVKLVNGSPFISINLKLEAKLLSVDDNSNYISEEKLSEISTSTNQYVQNIVSNYVYKMSKEFAADIDGFGKHALSLFKTMPEFQAYNWLENYQNSFFDITVDTNVQSAFLLSGT